MKSRPRQGGRAMLRKLLSAAGLASLAAALTQAVPAAACGSLIAPNGSVRLTHAATLVAWHDGVEHYLTNFSYEGSVPDIGYIIPLPAVPIEPVKEGGGWTLQRLFRETHPDLYLLTDRPLNTSALGAMVGQSAVGREVPGAPGLRMAFQESMNASLFHDLSTDKNMGWVRPDGWLSYLTLDAAPDDVTYDLSVTPMGVVKLAPFGTAPMSIVDGAAGGRALSLPTAPLGTPLAIPPVLLLAEGAFLVLRRN